MRTIFTGRIRILFALFCIATFILIAKLYQIQVVHGDEWAEAASRQYIAIDVPMEERGTIFFTPPKEGPPKAAARQLSGYRVAIHPHELPDAKEAYDLLSTVIPLEWDRFVAHAQSDGVYREVAFHLLEEEARSVQALDISGVMLVPEKWRFYPAQERIAHALGFVGFRGHDRVGLYGLERYYEDTLARDTNNLYVNIFADIFSNIRALISTEDSEREGNIITSIEPTVALYLEEELQNIAEAYSADEVGGIIMDPRTGEIIAMAAWPTFDPNEYNLVDDPAVFTNPLVERMYEFGSTVKPLTLAAGIDAGAITPSTVYHDAGFVMKSGKRISNYDGRGRGDVAMQEVLNQSLNTGVVFAVDEMGTDVFETYMRSYGLGEETGIDLPHEIPGTMAAFDSGTDVDYATASFGQGFAVTPIAMTRALATLTNGGKLVRPNVVQKIDFVTGGSKEIWDGIETQVLKPETTEEITRMLVRTVDDALLDGSVKLDHYSVAAKTGTAQMARDVGGGYYEDRYLHSFFGYFPAHDARFIIFLYVKDPKGVAYASATLTHPFMELTQFLINYYDIPPDR